MSGITKMSGPMSREKLANFAPVKRATGKLQEHLKETKRLDSEIASNQRKITQSSSQSLASMRARRGKAGSFGLISQQDTLG